MANLEPVEGISVEAWAKAQASMASGGSLDSVYQTLGIDAAKWERVTAEWTARMQNDTEFVIIPIYSAAFTQSASGNLGSSADINENTMPFEKFVEIMVAQNVLNLRGRDAQSVLADFGLTVTDFTNLSAFWSPKMYTDPALASKMEEYTNKYTAKYESMAGDSHSDLEF